MLESLRERLKIEHKEEEPGIYEFKLLVVFIFLLSLNCFMMYLIDDTYSGLERILPFVFSFMCIISIYWAFVEFVQKAFGMNLDEFLRVNIVLLRKHYSTLSLEQSEREETIEDFDDDDYALFAAIDDCGEVERRLQDKKLGSEERRA
jgi:hypothetical protein